MAHLCEREAAGWQQGDEEGMAENARAMQMRFLRDHLAKWIGALAERVEAATVANYYRAWADFARAFVAADAR